MQSISLVFPHQLFQQHPSLSPERAVYLVEDDLFFKQYSFHIQKRLLHRLSMKEWARVKRSQHYTVHHIYHQDYPGLRRFLTQLKHQIPDLKVVHSLEPEDYLLRKRLVETCHQLQLDWIPYDNPGFLTHPRHFSTLLEEDKGYFMHRFYIHQRKHLGILLENDAKPMGGKWSFDAENRKKIPPHVPIPPPFTCTRPPDFELELTTLTRDFPEALGDATSFNYAISHEDAMRSFEHFLEHKFLLFGPYEDAISRHHPFLFHSMLTPALNIGLITPAEVVDKTLDFAKYHHIPLNSLEGFIRQIIGWREFIRIVYSRKGSFIRQQNFFRHTADMPDCFYSGKSHILPMDRLIKQLSTYAYSHHIDRLMVAGNLMLLCGIHPDHIYQWFMEWYIDAYDWVMVPNVYSMSQYADGGLITTKPYLSGSAYLLKMSDYPKGHWGEVWDGLYWQFIHQHKEVLKGNPRMSMMIALEGKMPDTKRSIHQNHVLQWKKTASLSVITS
jgi:deoxyribodipyrimidine photolyase-related protein